MLKLRRNQEFWCVTQPDHAAVSGFLAAHWGGVDFRPPGYYSTVANPSALRSEVVWAIAQHDNGWWEWEASPERSPHDGLPLDLTEMLQSHSEGMNRWRRGIPRFIRSHPYGCLLICSHAYWLYAPRCDEIVDPAFLHPLNLNGAPSKFSNSELKAATVFVAELEKLQASLMKQIAENETTAGWTEPSQLKPNVRLLQVFDGLSLSLCSELIPDKHGKAEGPGRHEFTLADVPRDGWDDRVSLDVTPAGDNRIRIRPYPFDVDPLQVLVPTRILPAIDPSETDFNAEWHRVPLTMIPYDFCSA